MLQAMQVIEQAGKIRVTYIKDQPNYEHVPFNECGVAWKIVVPLILLFYLKLSFS